MRYIQRKRTQFQMTLYKNTIIIMFFFHFYF